ncbi:MAG TPA: protease inhibitor I42 family protein [Bacteroidales bacterium]|nr:protease inhibitor I42 family protein [Bacteroidales bacterium]
MNRPILYATLLLTMVTLSCASVKPDRQYTLSQGEEFVITLKTNPSTGYQWKIEEGLAGSGLVLLEDNYQPADRPSGQPIVGAGGTKTWKFRGAKPGKTLLKMVYQRPGEEKPAETKYFQVKIK